MPQEHDGDMAALQGKQELKEPRTKSFSALVCWLYVSGTPAQSRPKPRSRALDFRMKPQKEEEGKKRLIFLLFF